MDGQRSFIPYQSINFKTFSEDFTKNGTRKYWEKIYKFTKYPYEGLRTRTEGVISFVLIFHENKDYEIYFKDSLGPLFEDEIKRFFSLSQDQIKDNVHHLIIEGKIGFKFDKPAEVFKDCDLMYFGFPLKYK